MITHVIAEDLAIDDASEPAWIPLYAALAVQRLEKLLELHARFDEWLRGRV